MNIIVAEFMTSYQSDTTEREYFECSDWGFKKALKWCEERLPFDKDHTPRYYPNYVREFTSDQIKGWTEDFNKNGYIHIWGFQYSSSFSIDTVWVKTKEDFNKED